MLVDRLVVDLAAESLQGIATGVDPESGALLVEAEDHTVRSIDSGEVVRCRIG